MSTMETTGMKQNRIVITGGIATGKSTASSFLQSLGYPVIDADRIAKQALSKNEVPYQKAVRAFGQKILAHDGTIDRARLGEIVFSSETDRIMLNEITHPWIKQRMIEELDSLSSQPVVFLDIPLYFESSFFRELPAWLIYVPQSIQCQRLMERNGYTLAEAQARIRAQMDIEEKRKMADVVIDNSGSREELYRRLQEELRRL